ncbi:MAG: hypothetical protein JNM86_01400 [Phycisphaerae bacterium]|nr:hypothetical protein [Phycisphaerae bacterium]
MDLRILHSEAMDLLEKAVIQRAQGKVAAAKRNLADAFKKEHAAARLAVSEQVAEPTRAILLKSAAHLAVDVGENRVAEQLICTALAGDPPDEIAEELRSALEEIGFHRHLELRGIELQSNDAQLVLVGNSIAPGMAEADEFTTRVNTIERLIQRTSESERRIKYRGQGPPTQQVERALKLFVGLPRAASYAVSLRVADSKDQAEFQFAESAQILNLVVDRLGMYDQEDFVKLQEAIPDKQYYDNFVQLASELSPDGDRVRLVGLTTLNDGKERQLQMRRPSRADAKAIAFVPTNELRRLRGRVFFINTKDEENPVVKLELDDGSELKLKAEGDVLQKAVEFSAKKRRVDISGIQITRTTLQVNQLKALRRYKGKSKKKAQ